MEKRIGEVEQHKFLSEKETAEIRKEVVLLQDTVREQNYCRIERDNASLRGRAELNKILLQWLLSTAEYSSDAAKYEFL